MAKNKSQYDSTLNLPKTLFEMRAGLPKKEPAMLKDWEENDLYNNLMKHNEGKPQFILHDGPPYANGNIHMGTALNKIIKDIIIREKNMEGFQAPYVPGFDTHGLPIELKALSSVGDKKKDISKLELRQICEKFATEHIDIMSDQFKRLGVIGDFEHPYLTLKPEFEARQIEIFGEMAKKGYIYKGLKPVYWCPDCRTALAEAEIEYGEDDCDSIFVRFHVSQDPNGVLAKYGIPMDKTYFVIWTTPTWTLPANEAICLNGQFEYSFVKIGDEYHIMATELVKSVMDACHITEYEVVGEPVSGAEFELMRYNHVYLPKEGWVILGDHVTLESGSGCVHTAGGHGVDDLRPVAVVFHLGNVGHAVERDGAVRFDDRDAHGLHIRAVVRGADAVEVVLTLLDAALNVPARRLRGVHDRLERIVIRNDAGKHHGNHDGNQRDDRHAPDNFLFHASLSPPSAGFGAFSAMR